MEFAFNYSLFSFQRGSSGASYPARIIEAASKMKKLWNLSQVALITFPGLWSSLTRTEKRYELTVIPGHIKTYGRSSWIQHWVYGKHNCLLTIPSPKPKWSVPTLAPLLPLIESGSHWSLNLPSFSLSLRALTSEKNITAVTDKSQVQISVPESKNQ